MVHQIEADDSQSTAKTTYVLEPIVSQFVNERDIRLVDNHIPTDQDLVNQLGQYKHLPVIWSYLIANRGPVSEQIMQSGVSATLNFVLYYRAVSERDGRAMEILYFQKEPYALATAWNMPSPKMGVLSIEDTQKTNYLSQIANPMGRMGFPETRPVEGFIHFGEEALERLSGTIDNLLE